MTGYRIDKKNTMSTSTSINIIDPTIAPENVTIINVSHMFRLVNDNSVNNKSYVIFRSDSEIFHVDDHDNYPSRQDNTDFPRVVVLVSDPNENVTVNGGGEYYTASTYKANISDKEVVSITLDLDENGDGMDEVHLSIASHGWAYCTYALGVTSLVYRV